MGIVVAQSECVGVDNTVSSTAWQHGIAELNGIIRSEYAVGVDRSTESRSTVWGTRQAPRGACVPIVFRHLVPLSTYYAVHTWSTH